MVMLSWDICHQFGKRMMWVLGNCLAELCADLNEKTPPSLAMEEEECNTNLALSIGGSGEFRANKRHRGKEKPPTQLHVLFPLQEGGGGGGGGEEQAIRKHHSISSPTFDANLAGEHKVGRRRKKLRLSKEQVAFLEDSFTEHNTLNSKQKQELASKLSIQVRQVEVWFQNRRARTKLKKTEVDYESLKKCCQKLSEENQRLKEEIEELRRGQDLPLNMQPPKSMTQTMCPSCRRRADATEWNGRSKDAFSVKKGQENWSLCIMG